MNGRRWVLLVIVAVISLAAGFSAPHDAAHDQWWNRVPAFFALFGLVGCLLIIVFAKALGKALLQKKEGYYDAD